MYTDIQSTTLNNGTTSKSFKIQREVRQGCPLWAYLFNNALETLACKVRNDDTIKGIKIDNKEIKISLLTDDITIILADLTSVKNTLTVLNRFTKCADLKINIEKTQAKYISSKITCDYFPHGLSWIKTPIEALGIAIIDNESLTTILGQTVWSQNNPQPGKYSQNTFLKAKISINTLVQITKPCLKIKSHHFT